MVFRVFFGEVCLCLFEFYVTLEGSVDSRGRSILTNINKQNKTRLAVTMTLRN